MNFLVPLLELLGPLASVYDRKHKTKYKAEVLDLLGAIREEENKKVLGKMVNHARVDYLSDRVRLIVELFSADFKGANLEITKG